jgi:hypothetical protein
MALLLKLIICASSIGQLRADLCTNVINADGATIENHDGNRYCRIPVENVTACMHSVPLDSAFRAEVVRTIGEQVGEFYIYRDIIYNSTDVTGRDTAPRGETRPEPTVGAAAPCGLATYDIQIDAAAELFRIGELPTAGDFFPALSTFSNSLLDAHTQLYTVPAMAKFEFNLHFGSWLDDRNQQVFYLSTFYGSGARTGYVSAFRPVPAPWKDFENKAISRINGQSPIDYLEQLAMVMCHNYKDRAVRLNCMLSGKNTDGSGVNVAIYIPPTNNGEITIEFVNQSTPVTGIGWTGYLKLLASGGSSAAAYQSEFEADALATVLHSYFGQTTGRRSLKSHTVPEAGPKNDPTPIKDPAAVEVGIPQLLPRRLQDQSTSGDLPPACNRGLTRATVPFVFQEHVNCSKVKCTTTVLTCTWKMADGTVVEQFYLSDSKMLRTLASTTKYTAPGAAPIVVFKLTTYADEKVPLVSHGGDSFHVTVMALARKAVDLAADSTSFGDAELIVDTIANGGGDIILGFMVLSYLFGGIESDLRQNPPAEHITQMCSWGNAPLNGDLQLLNAEIMDLMGCFRTGLESFEFSQCAIDPTDDSAMRAMGERLELDPDLIQQLQSVAAQADDSTKKILTTLEVKLLLVCTTPPSLRGVNSVTH